MFVIYADVGVGILGYPRHIGEYADKSMKIGKSARKNFGLDNRG
jgi:hypothetical protein